MKTSEALQTAIISVANDSNIANEVMVDVVREICRVLDEAEVHEQSEDAGFGNRRKSDD